MTVTETQFAKYLPRLIADLRQYTSEDNVNLLTEYAHYAAEEMLYLDHTFMYKNAGRSVLSMNLEHNRSSIRKIDLEQIIGYDLGVCDLIMHKGMVFEKTDENLVGLGRYECRFTTDEVLEALELPRIMMLKSSKDRLRVEFMLHGKMLLVITCLDSDLEEERDKLAEQICKVLNAETNLGHAINIVKSLVWIANYSRETAFLVTTNLVSCP